MKHILCSCILLMFTSCVQLQPLTRNEKFIKQEIQKIRPKESSTSVLFDIYKSPIRFTEPDVSYIEITGYNGLEGKNVIIGFAIKSDVSAQGNALIYKYRVDHISLTVDEVKLLIEKLPLLFNSIPKTKRLLEETSYSEFRINSDLVLSVKLKGKTSTKNTTIDFWVKGERIAIPAYQQKTILKKLELFLSR